MSALLTLQNELPQHLTPRTTSESGVILALFVTCVLLTAIARLREKQVFLYLFQAVFFLRPLDDMAKNEYKVQSTTSVLFILQFLVITAGSIYWMFFRFEPLSNWNQLLIPLFVPGIYFIYQLIVSNLAARFSGNAGILQEFNYFTLVLTQLFGLLLLLELFVSYFQPAFVFKSAWMMAITYLAYLLLRLLRGFWIVSKQGVPWYYIILYFWTLEILPLLIAVKLLYNDEFQAWIG
ncbi:MAG TPA: DUF4271 domain-containing protein [Fluviicola sp.]|nr:DUF4271 domain-containing protein [Fluviicola sp.]